MKHKMKRICIIGLALSLMFSLIFQPMVVSADRNPPNPLVLMVISNTEAQKKEALQKITHYYEDRGFSFEVVLASAYSNHEALKTDLIDKYENHGLSYLILPVKEFRKKLTMHIDGEAFEQTSDNYFSNLYDHEDMSNDISVARSGVDDLAMIANRAFSEEVKLNISFAIINFLRMEGRCWIYPEVDPSSLGAYIKDLSIQKGFHAVTYFETEGDSPSGQRPDYALNKENIKASSANFHFYISTIEELRVDPDGNADINKYQHFHRAVFNDENNNGSADYGEVEVKEFFSFSEEQTDLHQIGFLPLFDNNAMNLNQFSAIIGHEEPNGIPIHFGESSGRSASYLAVLRLVMENLLSGKTVGESIEVYHQFHERFAYDPFKQAIFALTLFVRGDPTLRLNDLGQISGMELYPRDEINLIFNCFAILKIKNTGNRQLQWEIEDLPDWLLVMPSKGLIQPQNEQNIAILSLPGVFVKEKEGIIKIKTNLPDQPFIEIKVKRNFFSFI